jgi:hypothetical protein
MEVKWLMIGMSIVLCSTMLAGSYEEHVKSQCVTTAINNHMSVEDINKVCKRH